MIPPGKLVECTRIARGRGCRFDPLRPSLIRVAYRMLGSVADAEERSPGRLYALADVDRDTVRETAAFLRRSSRVVPRPPQVESGASARPMVDLAAGAGSWKRRGRKLYDVTLPLHDWH